MQKEIPCVEGNKAPGFGGREEGSFALLGSLAHVFLKTEVIYNITLVSSVQHDNLIFL